MKRLAPELRQYALVTGNYWAFTLTDGALRMLVVLHFHQLGYGALQIAMLFLFYEIFGVITNLVGGWPGGSEERIDAVIWCTGFRPALEHLQPLEVIEDEGRVNVEGTRALRQPGLWLVGYGDWTGAASATLIGVTRSARSTVAEVVQALHSESIETTGRNGK